jgi:hypothetical protein
MKYYATKDIAYMDNTYYIPDTANIITFNSYKDVESFLFSNLCEPEPKYQWAITDEFYKSGVDDIIYTIIQVPSPFFTIE